MGKSFKFNTTRSRSELMKKIRSVNTVPEKTLRKALWKIGFRYRLNSSDLPGKPDIVFKKHKIAIFVDGEFWHGFNWNSKKKKIKSNREYWIPKIEKNIKRDKKNVKQLKKEGWIVLRFWEHQIKRDLPSCLSKIQFHLK